MKPKPLSPAWKLPSKSFLPKRNQTWREKVECWGDRERKRRCRVEREKVGGEAVKVLFVRQRERNALQTERGGESVVCAAEGEKWGYLI